MSTAEDKFYHPRITKRIDFAPDLWMIRINPGGEFRFAPGQYATLGVDGSQKRVERPYSIVSSPYENEIEFFFELVPQGDLTPLLYKLQLGDEMLMRKVPKGGLTGENCVGYLCGHPEMIEHGKGILKRHRFPKEALKEEVYWIPDKKAAV